MRTLLTDRIINAMKNKGMKRKARQKKSFSTEDFMLVFAVVATVLCIAVSGCGPSSEVVPDVQGLEAASATHTLEGLGFDVSEKYEHSSEIPKGRVVRQSPLPGESAEVGSRVSLVISEGIADAAEGNICSTCGGAGRMLCAKCQGKGDIAIICPECDGAGTLGGQQCPYCNGTGTALKKCNACGGGGYLICPICRGTGREE